jgi:hypothetical protein
MSSYSKNTVFKMHLIKDYNVEKEGIMIGEDVGEDLEQVEEYQKKFDDFRKVRKHLFFPKSSRLAYLCDRNKIRHTVESRYNENREDP